jgi:hypothetical protein
VKYGLKLTLLGIGAFAAFFIATAPAQLVTGSLAGNTPLVFDEVGGTVWRGRAGRVSAQGVGLGPVDWRVHPLDLLFGRLTATVDIRSDNTPADLQGTTRLSAGLTGKLNVENADMRAGAEWAFALAAVPIAPSGHLTVQINHLTIERSRLPRVQARVRWLDAGVTYPQAYDLGEYNVDLQHRPEDEPTHILAEIGDVDSPLHVDGQARLQADGRFQLNVRVSTEPDAPQDIQRLLPLLGPTQPDGSVRLRRSGSIAQYL